MNTMPKLSVVVITYNEEKNIGRCLNSVTDLADDIVVIDSFSTDSTEEIVKSFNGRFIQHEFEGYIQQKNWAITQAKYPHILSLDADEVLSERLKESVRNAKANWKYDGYYFNRLTNYCGKWIHHTSWYPARKLRLWDSRKGKWGGTNPHDKFKLQKGSSRKFLKGDLYHYSYYSINEHINQINKFSSIVAEAYFAENRRVSYFNIILNPLWRIFRDFFIKLGFLDGFYGLVISSMAAYETFLKYIKLKNLYREEIKAQKTELCFFNSVRTWGGGEKWHFEMANRLYNKSLPVMIYTNKNSELRTRANLANIPNYNVRINNLSFFNPIKIIKLAHHFKKLKIKTIILNLSADVKVAGLAAKLAGISQIIYRRGSAIPIRNSILNRYLLKKVVHQVIANSSETKRTILSRNPRLISESRINIIYNGINLPIFDQGKREFFYERENDEIIIGNVGRLVKQKGQKYLIDLAIRLKKKTTNFKILIAGKGKLEAELSNLVAKNNLEAHFKFVGFVKDMKGFMQSIDIFILTSIWEGFGYVLVEAMACYRPIVAFDISSNPEIVEHNKTGYLVPSFDVKAMCEKVAHLIDNEKVRKEFGDEGRLRVEQLFSIEITQKNLEKLLADYMPLPQK